ncbi:hypothetical protein FRC01_010445 [Tulasnella sp. 417]|nr:hypothetical protein FRC01_010445 [Tulasnella sp. 417]
MNDKHRTSGEYIARANTGATYFQQHTPPRSPSSFDAGANRVNQAELGQPLLYIPQPTHQHPRRSPFSSGSRSSCRPCSNFKRRKTQLLLIYVGFALGTGFLLGVVVGSMKRWVLPGKYKALSVGEGNQTLGESPAAGSGESENTYEDLRAHLRSENTYEDLRAYLRSGNATNGFRANVFEGYCNLIYLALITQRIPVIPPLVPCPTHLGFGEPLPMINFGEVFDLPQLRRALRSPILEWKDVKRAHYGEPWGVDMPPVDGAVDEELGCWSTIQVIRGRGPHRTDLATFLKLDVAYTPVPLSVALPGFPDHSMFWGLASLTFEEGRRVAFAHDNGVVPGPTLHSKRNIAPDENLTCFDDLYFVSAVDGFEWERDWVEEVAIEMLKRVLGVPESREVPPFIAVHIRRDDFDAEFCKAHPEAECHPPLPVFRNRVRQVQEALAEKFGPMAKSGNVHDVIVTSDEKSATWWGEVKRMGWRYIDHVEERTMEMYGTWYPSIIDAVVQSMSIGFVGTQRSTMSRVAALRVRDWNGGVARMVVWNDGKGE